MACRLGENCEDFDKLLTPAVSHEIVSAQVSSFDQRTGCARTYKQRHEPASPRMGSGQSPRASFVRHGVNHHLLAALEDQHDRFE